jgi:transcriptional repressor NrdR
MNTIVTEITSTELGEMVLARLKECDIVAYIRFASIYRDFQDIDSFTAELKTLSKKPARRLRTKEDKE